VKPPHMSTLAAVWLISGLGHPLRGAEIAITIPNPLPVERAGEPVTCGIPLPRGFTASADALGLAGPDGKPVPVQVAVTATRGDGSPRWVLLDFLASVPAGGSAVYRLSPGIGRPAPPVRLAASLEGGVARIDAGAAAFTIDTSRFRLLDSARIGGVELMGNGAGPRGLLLELPGGATVSADETPAAAAFEEAGPLRATLCVRGRLDREGGPVRADYVCRLRFCAGVPAVSVSITLHNPAAHRHPGNIWDLGSGGSIDLEDFSIVLPVDAGGGASARVSGSPAAGASAAIYQDSSGGANWRSASHVDRDLKIPVTFKGWRARIDGREAASGDRIDGWVLAAGKKGKVAVAIREFWQLTG
jgi:hypothetical protein